MSMSMSKVILVVVRLFRELLSILWRRNICMYYCSPCPPPNWSHLKVKKLIPLKSQRRIVFVGQIILFHDFNKLFSKIVEAELDLSFCVDCNLLFLASSLKPSNHISMIISMMLVISKCALVQTDLKLSSYCFIFWINFNLIFSTCPCVSMLVLMYTSKKHLRKIYLLSTWRCRGKHFWADAHCRKSRARRRRSGRRESSSTCSSSGHFFSLHPQVICSHM